MAQITEDYVSFETAKLLKEKGFMKDAIIKFFASGYNSKGNILDIRDTEMKDYPRPTLQMAMKWLREIHHLIVLIRTGRKSEESSGHRFWFSIENEDMKELTDRKHQYDYCADAYEQACEDAIKYCLEHLI